MINKFATDVQRNSNKINCSNTGGCFNKAWIHDVRALHESSKDWICSKDCKDQIELLKTSRRVVRSKK